MTTYVVLARTSEAGFHLFGVADAHNDEAAISKAYLSAEEAQRTGVVEMVAVPRRSWKPQRISAEPQPPKLVLGAPEVGEK